MTSQPLLKLSNIVKEFPGVRALDGVSFEVERGEIHALCGENGAGKSTLMKIVSGLYPYGSYQGDIFVEGVTQKFKSIKDSQAAGVSIVFQELSLVRELSVAENIFLGREPSRFGIVDSMEVNRRTSHLLSDLGFTISPFSLVGELGIGQQQMVEIAKALALNAKILILDEPTSALTESEIEVFLSMVRKLKARGVGIVLITHKLGEVFSVADRITVIRDGRSVMTSKSSDCNEQLVIKNMVGRELKDLFPSLERTIGRPVLEVRGLNVPHPKIPHRFLVHDVNFTVREGEILGISGLMGSGRTEVLMSLFGAMPQAKMKSLRIDGRELLFKSPKDAIEGGLALVSEDRKRFGLVLDETVARNMMLSSLTAISKFGVVNEAMELKLAQDYTRNLRVKTPHVLSDVKNLSGGNQQKVVLAKWMQTKPKVLFLDEPTRGIDVGARSEIYKIILEMAKSGVAIVMVSSELPEVMGMSDRILVMCDGKISSEFQRTEATQERIMSAATNHSSSSIQRDLKGT